MSDVPINNAQFLNLKTAIMEYYNTFISNTSDVNTGAPFFFNEMKNMGNTAKFATLHSSGSKIATPLELSRFIENLIDFRISNDPSKNNTPFKVKPSQNNNLDQFVVNNIHRMLNIVNVFVDILEAFIWYMSDNQSDFKVRIKQLTTIHIVNKFTRPNVKKFSKSPNNPLNYGYTYKDLGDNTLILSINSFDYKNGTETTHVINPILTLKESNGRQINDDDNFIDDNGTLNDANNIKTNYKRQSVTYNHATHKVSLNNNDYTYSNENVEGTGNSAYTDTLNKRDKRIFNNFLYFLISMDRDNCRMQVNALYYYYKFIKNYILLICSTINLAMITSKTDSLETPVDFINITSNDTTPYDSSSFINVILTPTNFKSNINSLSCVNRYDVILRTVLEDILSSIVFLYETNSSKDNIMTLTNIDFSIEVLSNIANMPGILALDFESDASKNAIKAVLSNPNNVDTLKKRYTIVYRGKPYEIYGVDIQDTVCRIYIYGRLQENDTIEVMHLPSIDAPEVDNPPDADANANKKRPLTGVKIMNKGLLSLKLEYNSKKQELKNINTSILSNTSKINNQKNLYNYYKGKHTMLINQFYTYATIVGIIVSIFIAMQIMNSNQGTQQMISFVFTGVILILLIIYYVINVSYVEEFQNKKYTDKQNKVVETFAITKPADIINKTEFSDSNYMKNRMTFLSKNISIVNRIYLEYFMKIRSILPLAETQDFYVELNDVMYLESQDKRKIDNMLSYKRSLGYSNIDIIKYEINNYKVYISTMLFSFLIFSLLYVLSLFLPDDYRNLIIFVGLIFGIIIFSYFLIFTNKYVRTKSAHKYWGPTSNEKF